MEVTVVQPEKVQAWRPKKTGRSFVDVFRWQKWVDGEGRLWIVALLHGFDERGRYGANVELLDVDNEMTIDVDRKEFEEWIEKGVLKRVDTPILI